MTDVRIYKRRPARVRVARYAAAVMREVGADDVVGVSLLSEFPTFVASLGTPPFSVAVPPETPWSRELRAATRSLRGSERDHNAREMVRLAEERSAKRASERERRVLVAAARRLREHEIKQRLAADSELPAPLESLSFREMTREQRCALVMVVARQGWGFTMPTDASDRALLLETVHACGLVVMNNNLAMVRW